jgi:hypothetical protein
LLRDRTVVQNFTKKFWIAADIIRPAPNTIAQDADMQTMAHRNDEAASILEWIFQLTLIALLLWLFFFEVLPRIFAVTPHA